MSLLLQEPLLAGSDALSRTRAPEARRDLYSRGSDSSARRDAAAMCVEVISGGTVLHRRRRNNVG